MEHIVRSQVRPWNGTGIFNFFLTVVIGIIYIIYQLMSQDNAEDPFFVGILMANTYAVYRFTLFLRRHLTVSAADYKNALNNTSISFDEGTFIQEIFDKKKALFAGFLFGSIFFAATHITSPWGIGNPLNVILGIFLFSANVITGMALYGLYIYFKYSLLIGANIDVDLWDRSSPAIEALIDTNRYVVLATAFVACTGMLSILFSKFTLDYSILIFSVFSIVLILIAYTIPLIPVTTQIRKKKKKNIGEISQLIQEEYSMLLKAEKNGHSTLDISKFDSLLSIHKSVKAVRAFPPVGEQSINTAMSVAFLTMLPTIIEFMSKWIAGS